MVSLKYKNLRKDGIKDMHNNDLLKACKNDNELLGEFLLENRDFIFSIIMKYKGNISELKHKFNVDEDELLQLAYIGVISALEDFDFNRGTRFTTFVVRPILWELNQFLYSDSQLIRLSRSAVDLIKKIKEVETRLGYLPTEDELENILKISKERILDTIRFTQEIKSIEASEGLVLQNADYNAEDEAINKVYVQQLLKESSLTDFERDVIRLIMDEDLNNSQIAARLDVYPMTISRAIARIKQKLENTHSDHRKTSKYVNEISILTEEMKETGKVISIKDMKELLGVCGYEVSQYTPRVLYYIRQKSLQKVQ